MIICTYVWRDPNSEGWVDAWNGWYATLDEALEDAANGVGRPWVLQYGEGLITADEMEQRMENA